ncbi:MAG TPA: hypothetical protein VN213_18285 [Solirubrobacteraceae bacterium]|nr:hypothetical protein [Solirubrobacteraceae bacterium]
MNDVALSREQLDVRDDDFYASAALRARDVADHARDYFDAPARLAAATANGAPVVVAASPAGLDQHGPNAVHLPSSPNAAGFGRRRRDEGNPTSGGPGAEPPEAAVTHGGTP